MVDNDPKMTTPTTTASHVRVERVTEKGSAKWVPEEGADDKEYCQWALASVLTSEYFDKIPPSEYVWQEGDIIMEVSAYSHYRFIDITYKEED